jgi:hypothetical protein
MKANKQLATYLNNHLTASVGALELLDSLAEAQEFGDIARSAAELRAEIALEQQEVEMLMERLQVTKNQPRQVIGWLGEKITQIKLRMDDDDSGTLHLLESLELIFIGIGGKGALWRALAAAAIPGLPIADYERYAQQSEAQQARVEAMRIIAAKAAFKVA